MAPVQAVRDIDSEEGDGPSGEVIARVKSEFPHRDVAPIVMQDKYGTYPFVVTSPVREEWKKYQRELKDSAGDTEKATDAIERAALAQIRWPSRDEVKGLFDRKPGLVVNFGQVISELAGFHAEARQKK